MINKSVQWLKNGLAISIVLHLLLLYLLTDISVDAPQLQQPEVKAIKSYLYIAPKKVKLEPLAVVVEKTSKMNKEENLSLSSESSISGSQSNVVPLTKMAAENTTSAISTINSPIENEPSSNQPTSTDSLSIKNSTPSPSQTVNTSLDTTKLEVVNKPTSTLVQQKPAQLFNNLKSTLSQQNAILSGEQHYKNFKAAQNNVAVSTTAFNEAPSINKKKVDCYSTVNKSIAALSGLMGGTIECNKTPDLSPYIKARLDKRRKVDTTE